MEGMLQTEVRRKPGKTCNKCRLRKVKVHTIQSPLPDDVVSAEHNTNVGSCLV